MCIVVAYDYTTYVKTLKYLYLEKNYYSDISNFSTSIFTIKIN